jgi:hypothetical protein
MSAGQHFADAHPHAAEPVSPSRVWDLRSLYALIFYFSLSILFFGRPLFVHGSEFHVAQGPDPALMMWFLVWWPYAIAHGLNPMLTHAIWAPHVMNLAWLVCIPLASIIAIPLTVTLGPIAAFNTLCLVSLPLDAWCAFGLCRYLSRNYSAAVLGGYVFGFSAFTLAHLCSGHLQLVLIFPIPLAVYFAARRLAGEISDTTFTLILALLLVIEFLLSLEIFATMTMFGALAVVLALALSPNTGDVRARVLSLLRPIVFAYSIALTLVSPYLFYFFAVDFTRGAYFPAQFESADLANLFIPTFLNQLGCISLLTSISKWFINGNLAESGACLGLPVIVVGLLYARRHFSEQLGKLLIYSLIIIVTLSLGPVLHIAGRVYEVTLPWWPFADLPVLDNALPVDFAMYALLLLAMITSLWIASADIRPSYRIAVGAAIVMFNVPNLSGGAWGKAADIPTFFRDGLYKQYLTKDESVLILPYADNGDSMLWQAQSGMYFNMVEGSVPSPIEFKRWPFVRAFTWQTYLPEASGQLKAFLSDHEVGAIIVTEQEQELYKGLLSSLGVAPVMTGGVWLYRPSIKPERDTKASLLEMRTRFETERFDSLVAGAEKYLSDGENPDSLSVLKAQELKLIPDSSLIGAAARIDLDAAYNRNVVTDAHEAYGVYLGEMSDHRIGIGVYAWYPAVAPLIDEFRGITSEIFFPHPEKLSASAAPPKEADGWLVIAFTHEQLARASALLSTSAGQKTPRGTVYLRKQQAPSASLAGGDGR